MIIPDTTYILSLQSLLDQQRYDDLDTKNKVNENDDLLKVLFTEEQREPFIFRNSEEFKLMLSVLEVESEIDESPIEIINSNEHLLENKWYIPAELSYLNHESKIIVADTLYTYYPDSVQYMVLDSGESGTIVTSFGETNPVSKNNYSPNYVQGATKDGRVEYRYASGKNGTQWEIACSIGNESYSLLGVRRAKAHTALKFRNLFPSSDENADQHIPSDLESIFGKVKVEVKMTTRYKVLFKGCRTRSPSGSSSSHSVNINSGRCKDNGVTSVHNVTFYDGALLVLTNAWVN